MHNLLVFRKMSFLIHFDFSPLAGIFFLLTFFMKLQFMDTLKSLLTMIQPMHSLLVLRKMNFTIHFNFSLLACIFLLLTFYEITIHGHVEITFNSILSHEIALGAWWNSFSSFHISHISSML